MDKQGQGEITRICPICGQDNGCKNNKDCWCYSVTIPKGLLDKLREDQKGVACICKACIDKYHNKVAETVQKQ